LAGARATKKKRRFRRCFNVSYSGSLALRRVLVLAALLGAGRGFALVALLRIFLILTFALLLLLVRAVLVAFLGALLIALLATLLVARLVRCRGHDCLSVVLHPDRQPGGGRDVPGVTQLFAPDARERREATPFGRCDAQGGWNGLSLTGLPNGDPAISMIGHWPYRPGASWPDMAVRMKS
jgi:hypothetical protein